MNLINHKIKHKLYGVGTIAEQDNNYITVEFPTKTVKFKYPSAFEEFIVAEDEKLQESILQETKSKRIAEENSKKTVDEIKMVKEETGLKAVSIQKSMKVQSKHNAQKRSVFFVFQGNTFDEESSGGYIWAPITNKKGSNIHHWNRLLDVRIGDIILHGCDGSVVAISTAKTEAYECYQPEELRKEDLWDVEGRKVDCDYVLIKNPIKTSNYKDIIIKHSAVKYSPFNSDGSGNMGYLFELNRELARIFIIESINGNRYLLDYEFIKNFIEEKVTE
jgi:hypothetical protein